VKTWDAFAGLSREALTALRERFGDTIPSRLELLRFEGHIFPGFRNILSDMTGAARGAFCTQLLGSRFITVDMALALTGAGLVALSELGLPWQKELREERRKQGNVDEIWVQHTLAILDAHIRSVCMCASSARPAAFGALGPLLPIHSLYEGIRALCLDDWLESPAPGDWILRLHAQKNACGSAQVWARAAIGMSEGKRALLLEHRSPRFQNLFKKEYALLGAPPGERHFQREAWNAIICDCLVPDMREQGYTLSRCIGELRENRLLTRQALRLSFRDLAILTQALPRAERDWIYAELPRTLLGVLQAWLAGELKADFLITRELALEVRERFLKDGLYAIILALPERA
jgi:hypothetical protein